MKVLVTGAGGQLGNALAQTVPSGVDLTAADRAMLDITDTRAVRCYVADERPDVIINAASYTKVDQAEDEPEHAMAINADAVGLLADTCRRHGSHLVHISTDYVFDGTDTHAYDVSAVRNPLSVYGRSKAAGEDRIAANQAIVRTSWLYDTGFANFVTAILSRLREKKEVRVVDDEFGSPTWARGLAATVWKAALQKRAGRFHHCDAGVVSRYEFARAIADDAVELGLIAGAGSIVPIASSEIGLKARRPARAVLDTSSTEAAFSYRTTPWRDNLRRMLREVEIDA